MKNYKNRISVNGHYDPTKGKDYNNSRVANGWSISEYTWAEPSVRNLTTQKGISCNEYSTDHRSNQNWVGTNTVMLDFDDGSISASQLIEDQQTWDHDSYVYSSQNHQKPKEKNGTVDGYIYRLALDDKLVFIDTLKSKYMAGCKEPGLDDYVVREQGGSDFVAQFCKHHKVPYPEVYPRARFELVFNSDEKAEFDKGYVNKYAVTDLLMAPVPVGHVAKQPTYIANLIDHIMTHDTEIIDRYYNDLAWFVQNRKKLINSYLWQGVEGTGKGLFFSKVLQVIFGTQYCAQTDQDAFGTQFNSFLTDNVLVLVNEVSGNFSGTEAKGIATIEKMKIAITDEHIQIEGKNRDRFNGKNVCSFLFATNRIDAITLSENDRRFNVAPRQEVKLHDASWWPGYQQFLGLLESELQEFVWYLKQYQVDESLIGKVIDNEPKRVLQIMSQTNMEMFFRSVRKGDLGWLHDNIVLETSGYDADTKNKHILSILDNLIGTDRVSVVNLCGLYNNVNGKDLKPIAFGRIAAGHLGASKSMRINQDPQQGFMINWVSRDLIDEV